MNFTTQQQTYTKAIWAEDPAPADGARPAPPFWANPLFIVVIFGALFMLVILPAQRRQRREQQNMMATLKNGAKVLMSSGIIGTVVKAKDGEDEIVIRSEESKFRVLRSAVTRVLSEETTTETNK